MPEPQLLKTALHAWHAARGGRLVEFGGWSMPVQYTTIIEEHKAVRERVGLFDIGHMGRLTFDGPDVKPWLERLTTNHVDRLAVDQIQYSLMANDSGGLIDDVLVYRQEFSYLMVCNASNRLKVVEQLESHRGDSTANFLDRTLDTAMIAVQGPKALETVQPLFNADIQALPYYHLKTGRLLDSIDAIASRTGYTGEDGIELIVGNAQAERVWLALMESGARFEILPCGLGARDTLRFEAAMPLYGHELEATINPYAAGVGWAVKLNKGEFVGREALKKFKADPGQVRVGLELAGKRIARQGCIVKGDGAPIGVVTSGTFAPTLGKSLAMAMIEPKYQKIGTTLEIVVRDQAEPARVVSLPFYKREREPKTS